MSSSHSSNNHRRRHHHQPAPSGVALPAILQRLLPPESRTAHSGTNRNDILHARLQQTLTALQLTQQQIIAGEECYAEEAPTHNIFKGWDTGFIDAPAVSSQGGGGPAVVVEPRCCRPRPAITTTTITARIYRGGAATCPRTTGGSVAATAVPIVQ